MDTDDTSKVNIPYDNGFNSSSTFDNSHKSSPSYSNSMKTQNNNVKRNANISSLSESSSDAQKKFAGAKSISSDQFFSDSLDNTVCKTIALP